MSDANYVIIINNLVLNIPNQHFDCKLVDFCCECNTDIKILPNVMIGLFWLKVHCLLDFAFNFITKWEISAKKKTTLNPWTTAQEVTISAVIKIMQNFA